MKNLNRKDYINIIVIFTFIIGFIFFLYFKGFLFGSEIDWANQHIVIPEYFRKLFYEDKNLFPSFALNLGMGQNIYYFSYYGLFSPIILLSYLLPFIPMYIYIIIASISSLFISMIIFYIWIKDKYNSKVAFIASIIFLLNATFIYHFHRHIMFVIYMPFLINALKSVDLYFKDKKKLPLIIYTFLMIMTSYYFSVSGIITIGIYTLYKILENKKFNIKPLISIIYFVFIGILLSGIILIPTIYALSNGRTATLTSNISILNLFSPAYNFNYTFYNSYYSWGLTFIYIISIINGLISKKKNQIFLNSILALIILFPIFSYILNGFMYVDGKCYIPFIPLALLSVSNFLDSFLKYKLDFNKIFKLSIPIAGLLIASAVGKSSMILLIIDIVLLLITIPLSTKYKKSYLIIIPILIISISSFVLSSKNETYIKIKDLNKINNNVYSRLSKEKEDNNFYRISIEDHKINTPNKIYDIKNLRTTMYSSTANKNYSNFIRNIFQNEIINRDNLTITQTSNILFNIYSGTKYLITSEEPPIGYRKIDNVDDIVLYENENVLPIGYASNRIMSKREFDTLEYPYTLDALLNYIIVNKSMDNVYKSNVEKYTSTYKINNINNIEYYNKEGHYIINAKKKASLSINLNKPINSEVLIIKFQMNKAKEGYACSSNITINNITNALSCSNWKYNNNNTTFEYVISSNKIINSLDINFTEGEFDISNIELYTINYNNIINDVDEMIIDKEKSTSNKIIGTINAKEDGYVKVTIPYESKGFEILVDNQKVNLIKTDNAFLGFEIAKGSHNILIKYYSPYRLLGIITSIIGILLLGLTLTYQYTKKYFNKYKNIIKNYLIKIFKIVKKFIINNKGYIILFISLIIIDLALRIFYNKTVNYYHWYKIVPNLFSIIWIILTLYLTNILGKKGKILYLIFYIFSFIMFFVHAVYFSYFNTFFDYSVLSVAGEGADYFDSVLLNVKSWVWIVSIISIILTVIGLEMIKHKSKINYIGLIISILIFIGLQLLLPLFLGKKNKEVEWDDWRNARQIYTLYNDNNKSMMVSGLFQYNIRNAYTTYFKNSEELTQAEKEILIDNFEDVKLSNPNNYTGIYKGKNLILVQLESIDDFLVNKKIMPTLYSLSRNSINFTNHYSFTSGGGSTFNSEFMVNTGYSSAYNYNQSAYTFSRNNYIYSLPNLFKKEGYTVNAFHMNSSEYYSRGVNYKAFGYDSYNGLKDLKIYNNYEYWLDTELLNNDTFNEKIFDTENPFVSYIITYSAHMPYKTTKGTCSLLTDKQNLTEEECLKIQAKETDDFIKLLIDNLKEKNLIDNTVIVLFSDHYIYTLENKSLLDKYKNTANNLINHTPFMIYDNGNNKLTVKAVNSQLDILPTILNLFGIEYYPNNYIGRDILDKNYDPLVFFSDGSWYNGQTYVANGEYQNGKRMTTAKIEKYNLIVKRKMVLNDAVIKSNYFKK